MKIYHLNRKILLIFFGLLLFLILFTETDEVIKSKEIDSCSEAIVNDFNLKNSYSWNNFTFIHIKNGNWSNGVSWGWIKGTGSWGNPYVIENMTINAANSPTGSGILIENSKTSFFIIRNCTIVNAKTGDYNGGIKLLNSCNGTITNNNCSKNAENGIILYSNSKNNTISNNFVRDNTRQGIYLIYSCNNNTVFNNTAERNKGQHGIMLYTNCNNNTISGNYAADNDISGIHLNQACKDNLIFNNTIKNKSTTNQEYGIYVYSSSGTSNNNKILNNTLEYASFADILLTYSQNNKIINNSIKNNKQNAIRINSSNGTIISGNKMFGGSIYLEELIAPIDFTSMAIYKNNTINGRSVYYYLNKNGLTPNNYTNPGQIILYKCNNSLISDLNFNNGSIAIFNLNSFNNTIKNVTITNHYYGIYLQKYCNNNTISNTTIRYFNTGIYMSTYCKYNKITNSSISYGTIGIESIGVYVTLNSNENVIMENNISRNWRYGVYLSSQSNKNRIISNIVSDNNIGPSYGYGIYLSNCDYNTIINNTANNNDQRGIFLQSDSDYNLIANNTVNLNPNYGIYLYLNCDNNNITGNSAKNNGDYGIYLFDGCNRNLIERNNVYNNDDYGILLFTNCDNNSILHNNIKNLLTTNQDYGIRIWINCDNNTVQNNTIIGHTYAGIAIIFVCQYNRFINNTLDNNVRGLYFGGNENCTFSDNLIKRSSLYGIQVYGSSENNQFYNNIISNNTGIGVFIQDGTCNNNLFYENDFINNSLHAVDNGTNNIWDNGFIGNYWDNYTGVDANNDNIGDSPYYILGTAGSKDNFPIFSLNSQPYIPTPSGDDDDDSDKSKGTKSPAFELNSLLLIIILLGLIAASIAITYVVISKKKKVIKPNTLIPKPIEEDSVHKAKKIKEPTKEAPLDAKGSKKLEKERKKTEKEMAVDIKVDICPVHKGKILGVIYSCPKCNVKYCMKCARTLKNQNEGCWACNEPIRLDES